VLGAHPVTTIFGTSYLEDATDFWLFKQWLNIHRTLNPHARLIVVDSASPVNPELADFPREDNEQLIQLGDNIGHLMRTGRDGWGRAFCHGLTIAGERGTDWIVHVETDLLLARPVEWMIGKMEISAVEVCCPWALPYPFIETALMWFDGNWVRKHDLVTRYDWENGRGLPERRIEEIAGDDLWIAPLRGLRMDVREQAVQQPSDWITHASVAQYRQFLRANGIPEAP
jgi:hypothetical protein